MVCRRLISDILRPLKHVHCFFYLYTQHRKLRSGFFYNLGHLFKVKTTTATTGNYNLLLGKRHDVEVVDPETGSHQDEHAGQVVQHLKKDIETHFTSTGSHWRIQKYFRERAL